ncbi:LamG domain-containing protein [bacterium SCSIO 12741]|nr:LamG domain-containing protein [bacterium SCSIO 12741]
MKKFLLLPFLLLPLSLLFAQGSGKNLTFNGSSSYVNCGTINLNGSAVTLQGWVYVSSFKTGHPYISSLWGTETNGNQCMLRLGDGGLAAEKVQFVLYNGSTHYKLDGSKSLTVNQWYHIAGTYDGTTMRIYINGKLDASRTQTMTIRSNSTFEIGRAYAHSRILDGKIDEVSVFKAALSQNTIRDWMCQSINSSHPNYNQLEDTGNWMMEREPLPQTTQVKTIRVL